MTTLSNLQTRILVNGKPIKNYYANGQQWIEARDGTSYSIEVKNNSNERILAVLSVDGMNVINGQEAELEPENGYVISPYSNLIIDGWRISDSEVKEFIFNFNKKESYAVKLGSGEKNLGVIGLAFYSEKKNYRGGISYTTYPGFRPPSTGDPIVYPSWTTCDQLISYNAVSGLIDDGVHVYSCSTNEIKPENLSTKIETSSVDFAAGTGKGDSVQSQVYDVDFNTDKLIGMTTIYYDSFTNLEKRGIITKNIMPSPFKNNRYCPDIP